MRFVMLANCALAAAPRRRRRRPVRRRPPSQSSAAWRCAPACAAAGGCWRGCSGSRTWRGRPPSSTRLAERVAVAGERLVEDQRQIDPEDADDVVGRCALADVVAARPCAPAPWRRASADRTPARSPRAPGAAAGAAPAAGAAGRGAPCRGAGSGRFTGVNDPTSCRTPSSYSSKSVGVQVGDRLAVAVADDDVDDDRRHGGRVDVLGAHGLAAAALACAGPGAAASATGERRARPTTRSATRRRTSGRSAFMRVDSGGADAADANSRRSAAGGSGDRAG